MKHHAFVGVGQTLDMAHGYCIPAGHGPGDQVAQVTVIAAVEQAMIAHPVVVVDLGQNEPGR
ncbi:MAG: hypothetical protein ACXIUM_06390 [Wenzhouxiangella sp.]